MAAAQKGPEEPNLAFMPSSNDSLLPKNLPRQSVSSASTILKNSRPRTHPSGIRLHTPPQDYPFSSPSHIMDAGLAPDHEQLAREHEALVDYIAMVKHAGSVPEPGNDVFWYQQHANFSNFYAARLRQFQAERDEWSQQLQNDHRERYTSYVALEDLRRELEEKNIKIEYLEAELHKARHDSGTSEGVPQPSSDSLYPSQDVVDHANRRLSEIGRRRSTRNGSQISPFGTHHSTRVNSVADPTNRAPSVGTAVDGVNGDDTVMPRTHSDPIDIPGAARNISGRVVPRHEPPAPPPSSAAALTSPPVAGSSDQPFARHPLAALDEHPAEKGDAPNANVNGDTLLDTSKTDVPLQGPLALASRPENDTGMLGAVQERLNRIASSPENLNSQPSVMLPIRSGIYSSDEDEASSREVPQAGAGAGKILDDELIGGLRLKKKPSTNFGAPLGSFH